MSSTVRVSWTLERSLTTIRKTTSGCFLVLDRLEPAPGDERPSSTRPRIVSATVVRGRSDMRIQLRLRALGVQRDCCRRRSAGARAEQRPACESRAPRGEGGRPEEGRCRCRAADLTRRGSRTDRLTPCTRGRARNSETSRPDVSALPTATLFARWPEGTTRRPPSSPSSSTSRDSASRSRSSSGSGELWLSRAQSILCRPARYEEGDSHVLEKPRLP